MTMTINKFLFKTLFVLLFLSQINFSALANSETVPTKAEDPVSFVNAADKAIPAVVHINTSFTRKNAYYDDFFAPFLDFFNFQPYSQQYPISVSGSGVIIREDGYIITNNHVISDAEKITVTLNDKREYEATVIGLDPSTDLALIKIEENNLPFLSFGNSDKVKIGEWVLAVGNPFNLTNTVTAGIISSKARNINILGQGSSVESFLQTDAALNQGNSGGALVNTAGELIGINAAIASNTGSYSGYSFAIPSNIASKVANDLINYGIVQRAYIGAQLSDITASNAKQYGLSSLNGVYVQSVESGCAADKAGISSGDVILSFDGTEINSKSRLIELIAEKSPGDKVLIKVDQKGKIITKTLELLNSRDESKLIKKEDFKATTFLGATFKNTEQKILNKLNLKHGVQIESISNGPLKNAGIQEGFIITKIDKTDIKTIQDIEHTLSGKKGGVLIEGYYPNGMRAYYGFGL